MLRQSEIDYDDMYALRLDPPRPLSVAASGAWWRGAKARWRGLVLGQTLIHNPYNRGRVSQHLFEYLWNCGWEACDAKIKQREKRRLAAAKAARTKHRRSRASSRKARIA